MRFPLSWCHNFLSLPRCLSPGWASFTTPLANWSGMKPLAAEKPAVDLALACWRPSVCVAYHPLHSLWSGCFSNALGCKYLQENLFSIISFNTVNKHMVYPSQRHQQPRVLSTFHRTNHCRKVNFLIFKKKVANIGWDKIIINEFIEPRHHTKFLPSTVCRVHRRRSLWRSGTSNGDFR